jgi:GNAT superfamily N-acetyltransferase
LSSDGKGAEPFFESIAEGAIERYITAENFVYYVAENEREIVGVVAVRDNKHLYHLFISPRYQRCGLGKQLWQYVRQRAIAAGNPGEFTVNSSLNAVPVYQAFGFVPTSSVVEAYGVSFLPMRLAESE